MKIIADVRDYAANLTDDEKAALYPEAGSSRAPHPEEAQSAVSKDEAEAGMRDMREKFTAMRSEVYVEAEKMKESNKGMSIALITVS